MGAGFASSNLAPSSFPCVWREKLQLSFSWAVELNKRFTWSPGALSEYLWFILNTTGGPGRTTGPSDKLIWKSLVHTFSRCSVEECGCYTSFSEDKYVTIWSFTKRTRRKTHITNRGTSKVQKQIHKEHFLKAQASASQSRGLVQEVDRRLTVIW